MYQCISDSRKMNSDSEVIMKAFTMS